MKSLHKQHGSGFTLIELMIVVMILAILTLSIIPSFSSYLKSQNLKQAEENIKSELRSVQNKALTGTSSDQTTAEGDVRYWGIRFTNGSNSFDVFASATNGSCPSAAPIAESTINVSSGATINTACNAAQTQCCIYFDMTDGDINAIEVANLGSLSGSPCSGELGLVLTAPGAPDKHICFNVHGLIGSD